MMKFLNKKYSIFIFFILMFVASTLLTISNQAMGTSQISQTDYEKYFLGLVVVPTLYAIALSFIVFVFNIYFFRLFNYNIVDATALFNLVLIRSIANTLFSTIIILLGLGLSNIFNILTLLNPLLIGAYYLTYKYYLDKGYQHKQLLRYLGTMYLANFIVLILLKLAV